jgi:hypothetical protein
LTAGTEGKVFLAGLIMLALFIVVLATSWFFFPEWHKAFAAVIAGAIFFGRGAGISVGFAAGLSFWKVIAINVLIEMNIVLLFYPLFIFSWESMLKAGLPDGAATPLYACYRAFGDTAFDDLLGAFSLVFTELGRNDRPQGAVAYRRWDCSDCSHQRRGKKSAPVMQLLSPCDES